MIQVRITGINEIIVEFSNLPKRLQTALRKKFTQVINEVANKAIAQFPKSYDAASEISSGVEQLTPSSIIGFIEPTTARTGAIEFGGKGFYDIVPSKARLLVFIGAHDGKKVAVSHVLHPPMKGKHYIEETIRNEFAAISADLTNL